MPIIINEFEIVPEQPAQQKEAAPSTTSAALQETVIPEVWEILRLERVYQERMRRLWAD